MDITVPVKKIYGVLSSKSNSQRASMQKLARCRNVEDGAIDVCNDPMLKVNNNTNSWKYKEVMELNKDAVQSSMRVILEGSQL